MKFAIPLLASIVLLAPSVLADLAAPPPGLMLVEFTIVFGAFLLLNYGINFAISFPLTRVVSRIPAKKLAKGLLIITPIMLVLESIFILLIDPKELIHVEVVWIFSAVVIFLCYFMTGEKMWKMKRDKAVIIAMFMALLTNPAYLLLATI
ncbi:hypothetical protein KY349_03275 [Candidatus Woesearchaeota archaeon]|jgi:hypothetical protein|nr:hypothetical protein [Candidatus Woesearchaeota archaeon]